MKRTFAFGLLIFVLPFAGLFAQSNYTLIGGLNFATIQYNEKDINDYVDISANTGLLIGIESNSGPFKLGFAYIQRGASISVSGSDFEGSDTYNYLAAHSLIPIPLSKQFEIVGGLQIGKCLGGKWEAKDDYDSDSGTIDAEDINLDFGLLVGADIMFSPKFGVRGTYYFGLSDVYKDVESDFNIKNRGLAVNILIKI